MFFLWKYNYFLIIDISASIYYPSWRSKNCWRSRGVVVESPARNKYASHVKDALKVLVVTILNWYNWYFLQKRLYGIEPVYFHWGISSTKKITINVQYSIKFIKTFGFGASSWKPKDIGYQCTGRLSLVFKTACAVKVFLKNNLNFLGECVFGTQIGMLKCFDRLVKCK